MSVASSFERQMLDLINQERTSRGIDPLTLELRLNDASEDHSLWMDQTRNFSHTGVGGSDPGDRMRDAGFVFSGSWTWGENIAYQSERGAPGISDDVIDLHNGLMNSPGHRANILNPSFEVMGIGIEVGYGRGFEAVYVTQVFARTSAPLQLDEGGGGDAPSDPPPPPPPADPVSLVGNSQANQIVGDGGDNLIIGNGGADSLEGSAGDDIIEGGTGDDRAWGNQDHDIVRGGSGDDTLYGGNGNDDLFGEADEDRMFGSEGNDDLSGGSGKDRLFGGSDNDTLSGDRGNDKMTGGAGADVFIFSWGYDVVTDFNPNQSGERIDLSEVDTITGFNDLMFGGHLSQSRGNTIINDRDGNSMMLKDVAISELEANDFLF